MESNVWRRLIHWYNQIQRRSFNSPLRFVQDTVCVDCFFCTHTHTFMDEYLHLTQPGTHCLHTHTYTYIIQASEKMQCVKEGGRVSVISEWMNLEYGWMSHSCLSCFSCRRSVFEVDSDVRFPSSIISPMVCCLSTKSRPCSQFFVLLLNETSSKFGLNGTQFPLCTLEKVQCKQGYVLFDQTPCSLWGENEAKRVWSLEWSWENLNQVGFNAVLGETQYK